MLSHGTGKDAYYLIMLKLSDKEIEEFASFSGNKPVVVKMGGICFVPLQLEKGSKPGSIPASLYKVESGTWTGTTALRSFRSQSGTCPQPN